MSRRRQTIQITDPLILKYEGINLTESDLECLQPREYLNDKIINFLLKYMHNTLLNDAQQRKVHIFDTFFMTAIERCEANRMYRWLRNLRLFDFDHLMIPVNLDEHWFLMVLSNPEYIFNENEKPTIHIMDSMGVFHAMDRKTKLIDALSTFVQSACATERNISMSRVRNRLIVENCVVKEQSNLYDCGLFLLTNAEKFLIETFQLEPDDESVLVLSQTRNKRARIRRLIKDLAESQEIAIIQEVAGNDDDDGDDPIEIV